jgi:two-component system CheB/CheR fusion protein
MGIAEPILQKVFDLFAQADRSLDRAQGGLGLGLTIVKNLVEMHGGHVEAHSAGLGKGSEFIVRLPVLSEHQIKAGEEAIDPAPVSSTADAGLCCRILVVDDNVDSAESMMLLLQLEGHEVQMAHDGPKTLRIAHDFCPQVVLLDIGLPGMDGYEVARQLRRDQMMQGTVLVALTGYGQAEDRQRSKEAGFDHHLTKPVNHDLLSSLINSLIMEFREKYSQTPKS